MEVASSEKQKQDAVKDRLIKDSLKNHDTIQNELSLAYFNSKKKSIGLYSLATSTRKENYVCFESDDDLANTFCQTFHMGLTKIPDTNFLISTTYHLTPGRIVLQLLEFRSRAAPFDVDSMKFELRQSISSESRYVEFGPFAFNANRRLLATFSQENKCLYQLWSFDGIQLKYLRHTKWKFNPLTDDIEKNPSLRIGKVDAFDFDQFGDQIACITYDRTVQILDVNTNERILCAKGDDFAGRDWYTPYSVCRWFESRASGTKIICNRNGGSFLDFYDITKENWTKRLELKDTVFAFNINPHNTEVFAIGTALGTLWHFDEREPTNSTSYRKELIEHSKKVSRNWERQRVEWNPLDSNQILYKRGEDVCLIDIRKTSTALLDIGYSLGDVCFF